MPATLLVIDDEPNTLYSFARCLQSEALRVLTAATAREGIALAREKRPDAVVVDVRLPDMSGLDACDRIHRIDPRVPVIVITAHGTTETAIDATRHGAFEYLPKPVDMHELRAVVARALASSRASVHTAGEIATLDRLPGDATDVALGRLVRRLLHESRPEIYRAILARVDRAIVEEILRHTRGNQAQAAELLGISRTTLRAKLRALGIAIEKQLLTDDTRP